MHTCVLVTICTHAHLCVCTSTGMKKKEKKEKIRLTDICLAGLTVYLLYPVFTVEAIQKIQGKKQEDDRNSTHCQQKTNK